MFMAIRSTFAFSDCARLKVTAAVATPQAAPAATRSHAALDVHDITPVHVPAHTVRFFPYA
ncbi:hypothetical protein BN2476_310003 [Paraburkholderia piptadeniae]|uniref:Uncharacterized protein n=1 Tax=Paraburkholderia piptadeniae TaxID=1701573 RepID=A0A1N7S3J7_9BURK|nr:hypothetical protein BN2476_310003 [Paraburkholderia piptadeniae]